MEALSPFCKMLPAGKPENMVTWYHIVSKREGGKCYVKHYYATGKMGSFVQERERAEEKESFGMGKATRMLRRSKKVL